MPKVDFTIRYDRRVSNDFLAHFLRHGILDRLRVIANKAALPLDLQMRKEVKSGAQHATLYAGLTGVLKVEQSQAGLLRLSAHPTWSKSPLYGFSSQWRSWQDPAAVAVAWPSIELYLERVIPFAVRGHGMTEGSVQSIASKSKSTDWAILDREVTPSFKDTKTKAAALDRCRRPINAALLRAGVIGSAKSFGAECDLLAVDADGRLLAVEVKPIGGSIQLVPAQAAMYARVLQHWIDVDSAEAPEGDKPRDVIAGMIAQRQALGHAKAFKGSLPERLSVTPVVVLQRGAPAAKIDKMCDVRDVLAVADRDFPAVELYEVSVTGDFIPLD